jgi:hypothetical protein
MDEQLVIKTVVPEDNTPCHVTLNETRLTAQDAIKLGEQIIAAGRRAFILNQFNAAMQLYIPSKDARRQASREFLKHLR